MWERLFGEKNLFRCENHSYDLYKNIHIKSLENMNMNYSTFNQQTILFVVIKKFGSHGNVPESNLYVCLKLTFTVLHCSFATSDEAH